MAEIQKPTDVEALAFFIYFSIGETQQTTSAKRQKTIQFYADTLRACIDEYNESQNDKLSAPYTDKDIGKIFALLLRIFHTEKMKKTADLLRKKRLTLSVAQRLHREHSRE